MDDVYLARQLQRVDKGTGRDLKSIAFLAVLKFREIDIESKSIIIDKKHIEQAVTEFIQARIEMQYDD